MRVEKGGNSKERSERPVSRECERSERSKKKSESK